MNILMLGIKEYPYGISSKFEKYPGGGTARFIIDFSKEMTYFKNKIHIIVRCMPGQKKFEIDQNLFIFRVKWINNRYLRLPSFAFYSLIKAFFILKNIDLIHTHGSFDILPGIILSYLFKKPLIGTPHGLTSFQSKYQYHKFIVY